MSDTPIRLSVEVRRAAHFLFTLRLPLAIAAVLIGFYFIPQVHEFTGIDVIETDYRAFAFSSAAAVIYLLAFRNSFLSPSSAYSLQPPDGLWSAAQIAAWATLGLVGGAVAIFNSVLWSEGLAWAVRIVAALATWLASTLILYVLRGTRRRRPLPSEADHEFNTIFIGLLLLAAFTLTTFVNGVIVSKFVGPLAVVFLFLALLLMIFSPLDFWLSRYSVPFYTLLLFGTFFATQSNYGADHRLRRLDSGPTLKELRALGIATKSLPETFAEWLKCRSDFADYVAQKKPYPVFVVAAEGGGTYAAIHANNVLSQLTKKDASFPEHLFMISAVSGGAIGSAAYSASMSMTAPPPRPAGCADAGSSAATPPSPVISLEKAQELSRAVSTSDYLSPVVGGAAFPNVVQRFLPYSEPSLDRARWLEYAMEDTWQEAAATALGAPLIRNVFRQDYYTFWKPSAHYPGVVVNMVGAEDGFPMFLSPFDGWTTTRRTYPAIPVAQLQTAQIRNYLEYTETGMGVSLSTAVGMALRFPYVFGPAAILKTRKDGEVDPQHFVDGGYYDVTGLNSAALIYAYLYTEAPTIAAALGQPYDAEKCAAGGVDREGCLFDITLIVIGSFANAPPAGESPIFRGALFPIQTLNNTRAARAANTFALAELFKYRQVQFRLAPDNYAFPLGLYVKPKTANLIESRVGDASKCPSLDEQPVLRSRRQKPSEDDIKLFNSCSLLNVHQLLQK